MMFSATLPKKENKDIKSICKKFMSDNVVEVYIDDTKLPL